MATLYKVLMQNIELLTTHFLSLKQHSADTKISSCSSKTLIKQKQDPHSECVVGRDDTAVLNLLQVK